MKQFIALVFYMLAALTAGFAAMSQDNMISCIGIIAFCMVFLAMPFIGTRYSKW